MMPISQVLQRISTAKRVRDTLRTVSLLVALSACYVLTVSAQTQSLPAAGTPRLLVNDNDKPVILRKIELTDWAGAIYSSMKAEVDPYVERHQSDPQWILSRYQMNWQPGSHFTRHISDPSGTELLAWEGNAPYPTVRVTTHKRPPVAPDGYRFKAPRLEDIKPYDTSPLWYMQSSGPSGEWSYAEPRLYTGNINAQINELAVQAAILYWLTEEDSYARFVSDILFQWARGAYYQDAVEGAGRNGLFCIQSLGDRNYDELVVAYDFVRRYMDTSAYENQYFQPVFEKLAKTTKLRGFITNNWYAAQTTTLTYNALSLDDLTLRNYYLSFYLERDTINANWGQLGLPTTIEKHFTPDGHWMENAGYHDMPVGDLLVAAVPVENNGYRVFEDHPALYQASFAMLRYSFPNLQLMGYGDIGGRRHQSPKNLEIALRYASAYAPEMVPGLVSSLGRLIDQGLYDRSKAGWYGLLTYLAELPDDQRTDFVWEPSFGLDFARLYGQRNGTDTETGLMYYVQGATYNHNHANGMAMELYGRGYILGADAGNASTYEDSVFVHYQATFAAHNTVIAAGASQPSVPFLGSGGAKHMGQIERSAMEPMPGKTGVSAQVSFTETSYLEPSTQTQQQRAMGIVRTSPTTGYYVDIYRSDNPISNDYLYHNIGHELTLFDAARRPLTMQSDTIPYRRDRQSGMGWLRDIQSAQNNPSVVHAVFRVDEAQKPDVFMQMLTDLTPGDVVFTATGPRTRTAPSPISDIPTPKTIIHRAEAAWNEPFAVVYEPYRGEDNYAVETVRRIPTSTTLAALEVQNRNGMRQIILQSDRPETPEFAEKSQIIGHFGVVSVRPDNTPEYLYLGHGQQLGWNGYAIIAAEGTTAVQVQFDDDLLRVSSENDVLIRLPYRIAEARSGQVTRLRVTSATGRSANWWRPNRRVASVLHVPAGTDLEITIKRR